MTPNEILAYGFIAAVLLILSHSFAYRKGEDSMLDRMRGDK